MISTFILVLLIFFSGFLLPLERMSPLLGNIAASSPGAVAVDIFKESVFYSTGFDGIWNGLTTLLVTFGALLVLTLAVRYLREGKDTQ